MKPLHSGSIPVVRGGALFIYRLHSLSSAIIGASARQYFNDIYPSDQQSLKLIFKDGSVSP